MSKQFFEVFPTLKVNEGIQSLFTGVEVTKVATNSERDYLRIYILSNHLIQKKYIFMVEKLVKDQLFAKTKIQIHVVEKYDLSGQYTPENLMEAYRDSILFELEQRSVLEKSMFQKAKIGYEGENVPLYDDLQNYNYNGKNNYKLLHSGYLTEQDSNKNFRLRIWLSSDFTDGSNQFNFSFKVNVKGMA